MSKHFQVIVADPAWSFKDSLTMSDVARGASSNYQVMSNKDIEQLPIKDFIHPDGSILALWVPSSLLEEGLNTMKAWGFTHKQTYVWVKTKKEPLLDLKKSLFEGAISSLKLLRALKKQSLHDIRLSALAVAGRAQIYQLKNVLAFGMGRLFRQTHEICLIGISDNKIYKKLQNKSQRSVCFAENLRHSAKPEDLQDSLDTMFPKTKKLELFARRHRPGWVCLGNEICNGEDIRVSLGKL